MKKSELDDAFRVLGFNLDNNGRYIYHREDVNDEYISEDEERYLEDLEDKNLQYDQYDEDYDEESGEEESINQVNDDDEEESEDANQIYADEEESIFPDDIADEFDDEVNHSIDSVEILKDDPVVAKVTVIKNGTNEDNLNQEEIEKENEVKDLTVEEALTALTDTLLSDKSILDVNDADRLFKAAMVVSDKITEMAYKSNSDYVGKVRALESKIENYKKEYEKAKDLTKKLYLIAQAEERFFKHISEFGTEEQVLSDMQKAVDSWHKFILEKTGIDLENVRDIGVVFSMLKERSINDNGNRK